MIKKLILKNVKNFRGEHVIDFTIKNIKENQSKIENGILKNDDYNLMLTPVFLGGNSTGKSTILHSLKNLEAIDNLYNYMEHYYYDELKSILKISSALTIDIINSVIDNLEKGQSYYLLLKNKFSKEGKDNWMNELSKDKIYDKFYKLQNDIFKKIKNKINIELDPEIKKEIKNLIKKSQINNKTYYEKILKNKIINKEIIFKLIELSKKEFSIISNNISEKMKKNILGKDKESFIEGVFDSGKIKRIDFNFINLVNKKTKINFNKMIDWFMSYINRFYELDSINSFEKKLQTIYVDGDYSNIKNFSKFGDSVFLFDLLIRDWDADIEAGKHKKNINDGFGNIDRLSKEILNKIILSIDSNVKNITKSTDNFIKCLELSSEEKMNSLDWIKIEFKNGEVGPLNSLSYGTIKILKIISYIIYKNIFDKKSEFVVIDEIENGLNYGLIEMILEFAKEQKVQVVMSSHNPTLVSQNLISPLNAFVAVNNTFRQARDIIDKKSNRPETLKSIFSSKNFFNPYFWNSITSFNNNIKTLPNNKIDEIINSLNKIVLKSKKAGY